MARYRALSRTFVNDTLVEPGQEFESDKEPGESWTPLDAEAEAAVAEATRRRATKAAAVAAGVATQGNEELVAIVREQIDLVAALAARVTQIEAATGPLDLSKYARTEALADTIGRLNQLADDVHELDVGLQLIDGRVSELEGVQAALAGGKAPARPTPPPDAVPTTPVDIPAEPAPADPAATAVVEDAGVTPAETPEPSPG